MDLNNKRQEVPKVENALGPPPNYMWILLLGLGLVADGFLFILGTFVFFCELYHQSRRAIVDVGPRNKIIQPVATRQTTSAGDDVIEKEYMDDKDGKMAGDMMLLNTFSSADEGTEVAGGDKLTESFVMKEAMVCVRSRTMKSQRQTVARRLSYESILDEVDNQRHEIQMENMFSSVEEER